MLAASGCRDGAAALPPGGCSGEVGYPWHLQGQKHGIQLFLRNWFCCLLRMEQGAWGQGILEATARSLGLPAVPHPHHVSPALGVTGCLFSWKNTSSLYREEHLNWELHFQFSQGCDSPWHCFPLETPRSDYSGPVCQGRRDWTHAAVEPLSWGEG